MHTSTVNRRLKELGLKSNIAAVKDILTDEHRAGRLAFARRYVHQPVEFWRRVIFTDEKSWSSASHGRVRVRRLRNDRFEKRNQEEWPNDRFRLGRYVVRRFDKAESSGWKLNGRSVCQHS